MSGCWQHAYVLEEFKIKVAPAHSTPFCSQYLGLTSILSQFRQHFQALQEDYMKDKWVVWWKINPISLNFVNELGCLSSPVLQHTYKQCTSSCDYERKQPESWNLFHGSAERLDTWLLVWLECQIVWKSTMSQTKHRSPMTQYFLVDCSHKLNYRVFFICNIKRQMCLHITA